MFVTDAVDGRSQIARRWHVICTSRRGFNEVSDELA